MPLFAIYKYDFKEGEKTLMSQETGKNAIEEAQEHFGQLFNGKQLNLYKMAKKNTEPELYKNDIFCTRNGVTLMTVFVPFLPRHHRQPRRGLSDGYRAGFGL